MTVFDVLLSSEMMYSMCTMCSLHAQSCECVCVCLNVYMRVALATGKKKKDFRRRGRTEFDVDLFF